MVVNDILIVEDEAPKREHLIDFVSKEWPQYSIRTARSVRSAIDQIEKRAPTLLLLDMSLPTFDIGPSEPGGRPQGFGGVEVMRYLDLYGLSVPTIVVTAYEAFSREGGRSLDHQELDVQLRDEHGTTYCGVVYYNSLFSDWRIRLSSLISKHLGGDQQ